jgi:hypothetical protein
MECKLIMLCSTCPALDNICAGGIVWNGMCIDFRKALAAYVKVVKKPSHNKRSLKRAKPRIKQVR